MYCFAPVIKGLWKQHELWDGTYILTDLIDIHEALDAQRINENLVNEFYQIKAEKENASMFRRK